MCGPTAFTGVFRPAETPASPTAGAVFVIRMGPGPGAPGSPAAGEAGQDGDCRVPHCQECRRGAAGVCATCEEGRVPAAGGTECRCRVGLYEDSGQFGAPGACVPCDCLHGPCAVRGCLRCGPVATECVRCVGGRGPIQNVCGRALTGLPADYAAGITAGAILLVLLVSGMVAALIQFRKNAKNGWARPGEAPGGRGEERDGEQEGERAGEGANASGGDRGSAHGAEETGGGE